MVNVDNGSLLKQYLTQAVVVKAMRSEAFELIQIWVADDKLHQRYTQQLVAETCERARVLAHKAPIDEGDDILEHWWRDIMTRRSQRLHITAYYETHRGELVSYAQSQSFTGNRQSAEDVLQDLVEYLTLMYIESSPQPRSIRSMQGLFKRAIINRVRNEGRQDESERAKSGGGLLSLSILFDEGIQVEDKDPAHDPIVLNEVEQQEIGRLITHIKNPEHRQILALHLIEEHSIGEIAKLLNKNYTTVKSIIRRTEGELRKIYFEQLPVQRDELEQSINKLILLEEERTILCLYFFAGMEALEVSEYLAKEKSGQEVKDIGQLVKDIIAKWRSKLVQLLFNKE